MCNFKPFQIFSESSSESQAPDFPANMQETDSQAFAHYKKIKDALWQNEFVNSLLLDNQIPKKVKYVIARRIKNYV